MQRHEIKINELCCHVTNIWLNRWFLVTSGNMEKHNMMTVAWGSIGGMWNKPFVQVVIRPTRYTYDFMNDSDTFTLCSFPREFKNDLMILGTKSGRNGNKLLETKLSIKKSKMVKAPSYNEADLIIECKKIYFQDMDKKNFLDSSIHDNYKANDYHRIYFGEILFVEGIDKFRIRDSGGRKIS